MEKLVFPHDWTEATSHTGDRGTVYRSPVPL